jgi:hypothetical protein
MSAFNVAPDLAKQTLHAVKKAQQQKQTVEEKNNALVKQDPSQAGVQWAHQQAQAQAVVSNNPVQKAEMQNVSQKPVQPEVLMPEDTATLSSTVSMNREAVEAPRAGIKLFARMGLNAQALEESFREIYRKSKSHNLLLERFMSNVKVSGLMMLMSFAGVSAEKIEQMKKEAREEALSEIHTKLENDWAYAKAMLEIVG